MIFWSPHIYEYWNWNHGFTYDQPDILDLFYYTIINHIDSENPFLFESHDLYTRDSILWLNEKHIPYSVTADITHSIEYRRDNSPVIKQNIRFGIRIKNRNHALMFKLVKN